LEDYSTRLRHRSTPGRLSSLRDGGFTICKLPPKEDKRARNKI
jgi:hypothetical protein